MTWEEWRAQFAYPRRVGVPDAVWAPPRSSEGGPRHRADAKHQAQGWGSCLPEVAWEPYSNPRHRR